MIENGRVTYPDINRTLSNYQPPSEVLNAFLVAMLTTILTYQLAAIIFDILLGLKAPGQTTASDMSTLILTEDSSLLSIMASLNISRTITRWKFYGVRSSSDIECHASRHRIRISYKALFKFFVLLIAAPFASTLSVFLTIERDIPLTFADVRFGGIAFGLNENLSTPIQGDTTQTCVTYDTTLSRLEVPLAEFSACFTASLVKSLTANESDVAVFRMSHGPIAESRVARVPQDAILVEVDKPPFLISVVMFADLRTPEGVFRVKEAVNLEFARALFENGVLELARICLYNVTRPLNITETREGEESWSFEWEMDRCSAGQDKIGKFLDIHMVRFTLIDSPEFNVLKIDTGESLQGDDQLFLERRRSFATFAVLGITTLVVVAIRIIIRIFTNNDVHLGIEVVLKDALRINRCDSMLQNNRQVDYSAQVYEGLDDPGNSLTISDWDGSGTLNERDNRI
eukprot:GFKZ01008100.1.p1 GENE.GFKZ01008100.1~~GFKZ01008100.1.p1  ORF type:complete len:458 (+),score=45.41 GFKZ01008100.1:327-1700(+)